MKRGRQCSSLEKQAAKALVAKDVTEKELKEAEAEWTRAVEEKLTTKLAEEASRVEADLLARRVSDLESELAILRADLEAEATAKEGLQAELAEVRVESAKEKMARKEAISKAAKQSALLESLSCRLAAAEQGVEAAKVDAVEAFKDSQAFADAVAECSTDSYQLEFADCKEAMVKLFPELDLSGVILPGGKDEEEEAAAEGVADLADASVEVQRVDESASVTPTSAEAEGP